MFQETGAFCYLYHADSFMREALSRLGLPAQQGAVDAVGAILQQDDADYRQREDQGAPASDFRIGDFQSPGAVAVALDALHGMVAMPALQTTALEAARALATHANLSASALAAIRAFNAQPAVRRRRRRATRRPSRLRVVRNR